MNDRSVVLLSGGLDSAVCLALCVDSAGSGNVIALNAYYGQRHRREIESARAVAAHYGVEYHEMDLEEIFRFSDCPLLEGSEKPLPRSSYAEQSETGRVSTYVPFRNGLLVSAAASFAMSVGAGSVVLGVHSDDSAGNAYPDCSVGFIEALDRAVRLGTDNEVGVKAPFASLTKADVVKAGDRLGVPFGLTWSCYEGGQTPCGACATCRDRQRAFEANGLADPLA